MIDVEIGYASKVTEKSDVYSYGVILLELITGKEPTGGDFKDVEGGNLVGWVKYMMINGRSDEVLDPLLLMNVGAIWKATMLKLLHVAFLCTNEDPFRRPSMLRVLSMLKDMDSALQPNLYPD